MDRWAHWVGHFASGLNVWANKLSRTELLPRPSGLQVCKPVSRRESCPLMCWEVVCGVGNLSGSLTLERIKCLSPSEVPGGSGLASRGESKGSEGELLRVLASVISFLPSSSLHMVLVLELQVGIAFFFIFSFKVGHTVSLWLAWNSLL